MIAKVFELYAECKVDEISVLIRVSADQNDQMFSYGFRIVSEVSSTVMMIVMAVFIFIIVVMTMVAIIRQLHCSKPLFVSLIISTMGTFIFGQYPTEYLKELKKILAHRVYISFFKFTIVNW